MMKIIRKLIKINNNNKINQDNLKNRYKYKTNNKNKI